MASLFALHPEHNDSVKSFGETFCRIKMASQGSDGPERRFVALLNAHRDEAPSHLRHAVSLAESKGVPINYESLLMDIIAWDSESKTVQKRWAGDFWGFKKPESE